MKSIEMSSGGPIMPRSKSRAIVRSVVSSARSRWAMPGGATQVEMRRSYRCAAIRAPRFGRHHLMQRLRDQQQRERRTHHHQRPDQRHVAGDRADQPAEGDRGDGGQRAAQHDEHPPADRVRGGGAAQGAEELPLLPSPQPIDHVRHLPIAHVSFASYRRPSSCIARARPESVAPIISAGTEDHARLEVRDRRHRQRWHEEQRHGARRVPAGS